MEISHVISESILAFSGFFAFYYYLRKLHVADKFLWGTFIILVALAALCAALSYAGFTEMGRLNIVLKQIAASTGVLLLVIGISSLVYNKHIPNILVYRISFLGIISSIILIITDLQTIIDLIPSIGISIVFLLGISALNKRKFKIGFQLILGTFFSILANFIYMFELPINQIDAYCFLLSAALICFGSAGGNTEVRFG